MLQYKVFAWDLTDHGSAGHAINSLNEWLAVHGNQITDCEIGKSFAAFLYETDEVAPLERDARLRQARRIHATTRSSEER